MSSGTESDTTAELVTYLVRLGMHGQIGRLTPAGLIELSPKTRVVCRTARGLEVGEVLRKASMPLKFELPEQDSKQFDADGRIVRRMRPEDELLWGHLRQLADSVLEQCSKWLASQSSTAVLLEVEPLLDGKTLYFHFLTEMHDSVVQEHLDTLVEYYEQEVRSSKFANLLKNGCGPGCGTDKAENGCGSKGGCAVCKVASQCGKSSV